jgi:hypothetical protein
MSLLFSARFNFYSTFTFFSSRTSGTLCILIYETNEPLTCLHLVVWRNNTTVVMYLNLLLRTNNTFLVKVKQSRYTPWRRFGGEEYSSYSFTTSALDWGEWSASRPGRALPPVPIVQEAGWASEPVWTQRLAEKMLCPRRGSNPDRPVVQPVVRHYTAWANPAPNNTFLRDRKVAFACHSIKSRNCVALVNDLSRLTDKWLAARHSRAVQSAALSSDPAPGRD